MTKLPGEKQRVKHKVTRLTGYKRDASQRRAEVTEEKQTLEEMMRNYRRSSSLDSGVHFPPKQSSKAETAASENDKWHIELTVF